MEYLVCNHSWYTVFGDLQFAPKLIVKNRATMYCSRIAEQKNFLVQLFVCFD